MARVQTPTLPLSRARHPHLRRWIWIGTSLAAAVVIVLALLAAAVPLSSDALRHRIVAALSERLDSDVSLGDLHWRVFPRLRAEGEALVIRQHGRDDQPPLITVKRFSVEADLIGLLHKHVSHVQLEGLDIEIPPDRHPDATPSPAEQQPATADRPVATIGHSGGAPSAADIEEGVVLDSMDSDEARLAIISSHPDKPPKVWNIHKLHVTTVGVNDAMAYQATLTNGIPRGEIVTTGSFGPWQRDEPGRHAARRHIHFRYADLSIFKGIAGMLSSKG